MANKHVLRIAKIAGGLAIFALAVLSFPLVVITLQDLYGALVNGPFAHCEVMDKTRLETALPNGFTVNGGCCAEHMIGECSIARPNSNPLLFAVENENLEAVRLLIERGADVNQSSTSGYALAEAATRGRMDIVAILLARGIDAPARDAALRLGAHAGQTEAVKLILDRTAPDVLGPSCGVLACSLVSELDQTGSPALEKQRRLFLHVIRTCVDPNMICSPNRLLSLVARQDAHAPLVEALLARGADLEAKEAGGKSVRDYLRSFSDYESRPKIKELIEAKK